MIKQVEFVILNKKVGVEAKSLGFFDVENIPKIGEVFNFSGTRYIIGNVVHNANLVEKEGVLILNIKVKVILEEKNLFVT